MCPEGDQNTGFATSVHTFGVHAATVHVPAATPPPCFSPWSAIAAIRRVWSPGATTSTSAYATRGTRSRRRHHEPKVHLETAAGK